MIHLTRSTKNQTFQLRFGWLLIFNGIVPRATWADKGGAEAQLELLESGYSVLAPQGGIKHVRASLRDEAQQQETMRKYCEVSR